jgi:drug/metabolite transporter (DMT)-like permease
MTVHAGTPASPKSPASPASQRTLAFLALLAGAVTIGFAGIFVRLADVSPTASAFWRVALAAPVLWLWWRLAAGRDEPLRLSWRGDRAIYLCGLMFACDLGVWHIALVWTSVANATVEGNLAPIFVTLAAWLLWRQKPSKAFVFALALTIAGAIVLVGPHFNAGGRALTGDALGVLTAVFYAGYMLALKRAMERTTLLRMMAISTTVMALALLPYALLTADRFLPQNATGWAVLAALALGPHVMGQGLISYGFSRLPVALSSVTLLLQVVVAALAAWLLLGEVLTPLQMAGGVIVLAGIYLARRTG